MAFLVGISVNVPGGIDASGYQGGRGSGADDIDNSLILEYYGGGGGGSGFRGGGGGSMANVGDGDDYRNDSTASGGGGGSSAIRTSSFPDGIVSVVIKSIESNQGSAIITPANGTQIVF